MQKYSYLLHNVISKDSKYEKTISVNPLYFISAKRMDTLIKIDKNNYLTPVPTNETKEIKKYEELWNRIRDLMRLLTKN